jgi:hypothetical protein
MGVVVDVGLMAVWDANNLNVLVPGGVWDGDAPPRTPYPYAIFNELTDLATNFTSGGGPNAVRGKIMEERFTITIYTKEDGVNDPKLLCGQLVDAIRPIYENAGKIELTSGQQLLLRHVGDLVHRVSSGIYRGVITFRFRSKHDVGGGTRP